MKIDPNANIEVTEFARDSGFMDGAVYCRFETSSKVLDDIFVNSVADAIVRKTTFTRIKPILAQPEWWSSADSDSDKWSSRPIKNERRILEFVFIENTEGFTVLGLAGSF